jgi:hypothetical protein
VPVVPNVKELLDLYRLQLGNPTSGVMFSTANGTPVALHNLYFDRIDPVLNPCEQCGKSKKLLIAVIVGRRTTNTDGGKGWS